MSKNKLIIAGAGSGKTEYLIMKALEMEDENVLITTYTEANEAEIRKKITEKEGCVPKNITVQTWFSFLLQHGVRPYQCRMKDELHSEKIGFHLTEKQSGRRYNRNGNPIYWGEENFFRYYFTKNFKIYSDKISKFIFECNKKTKGEIIERISRIYPRIYIDEVQDLAGWELEILKLLFGSKANILLVGDPRQTVYSTHNSQKFKKYKCGKIKEFIEKECKRNICDIDEDVLQKSHRNNKIICDFSSKLYPEYAACKPCKCEKCRIPSDHDHQGLYLVKKDHVEEYCQRYNPQKLHYQKAEFPDLNFGVSKGLSFERILIYPTERIINYLKNGQLSEIKSIKAKFYMIIIETQSFLGVSQAASPNGAGCRSSATPGCGSDRTEGPGGTRFDSAKCSRTPRRRSPAAGASFPVPPDTFPSYRTYRGTLLRSIPFETECRFASCQSP